MVIEVGDQVRIGESGAVSSWSARSTPEGRALIEADQDAPGRYPFSMPLTALVPAAAEPLG